MGQRFFMAASVSTRRQPMLESADAPMKLSRYTECALLLLTYLVARPWRLVSIGEIARAYQISHNHLIKIVPDLRKAGFVDVVRGREGGMRLAREPKDIRMAELVSHTERRLCSVQTEDQSDLPDQISDALQIATKAFVTALEGYTLADLVPWTPSPQPRLPTSN